MPMIKNARELALSFIKNFEKFPGVASNIKDAGPVIG